MDGCTNPSFIVHMIGPLALQSGQEGMGACQHHSCTKIYTMILASKLRVSWVRGISRDVE